MQLHKDHDQADCPLSLHSMKNPAFEQNSASPARSLPRSSQSRHSRWKAHPRQTVRASAIAVPPHLRAATSGSTSIRSMTRSMNSNCRQILSDCDHFRCPDRMTISLCQSDRLSFAPYPRMSGCSMCRFAAPARAGAAAFIRGRLSGLSLMWRRWPTCCVKSSLQATHLRRSATCPCGQWPEYK